MLSMEWVTAVMLAFARIASFLFMVPFLKGQTIPSTAKVALSFALACFAAPQMMHVDIDTMGTMVGLLILQVSIGFAMAFFVEMFFQIATMAGSLLDFDMGLSMAEVVDPTSGRRTTVMATIYHIVFTVLFVATGGVQVLVAHVVYSFTFTNPHFFLLEADFIALLLGVFAYMLSATISLALPFMATIFMVNFIFLIIGRATPQINIFANIFIVKIMLGFIFMFIALPYASEMFVQIQDVLMERLLELLELLMKP